MTGLNDFAPALDRARRRARAVERLEAWSLALAPSAAMIAGWTALALLGLPLILPTVALGVLALAVLVAALVVGARRAARLPVPDGAAIDRRIERATGLAHRPLTTLADRPATGTAAEDDAHAGGGAVWRAHQARVAASLGSLRSGWPRPALATADRFRLRFALPILLACGLLLARGDAPGLLLAALLPGLAPAPGPAGDVEAWITPPAFSGLAPVFLRHGVDPPPVPAGSVFSAGVTGSDAVPRLLAERAVFPPARFRRIDPTSWQVNVALGASGRVRIRQGGHALDGWSVVVDPVGSPAVAWSGPPGAWHGGWRTRLPWRVGDRFGVTSLRARLVPLRPAGAPAITVAIPLDGAPRAASGVEMPDLSQSPFAGTGVAATLLARNGAGRTGTSTTVRFTLPARPFRNPLARAVLDVRRRLALSPDDRKRASDDLAALGDVPGAFAHRLGPYLNLMSVAALLQVADAPNTVDAAEARLWTLALQLEDGDRAGDAAARGAIALDSARDALDRQVARMRALGAKGRTATEQAKLQRRLDAFRRALAQRLSAIGRDAMRHGMVLPPGPIGQALGSDALDRTVRQIGRDAAAGNLAEAENALAHMEDMLDRLRPATANDVRQALASMAARSQAADQMRAVGDLVKREAALFDRTDRRNRRSDGSSGDADVAPTPPLPDLPGSTFPSLTFPETPSPPTPPTGAANGPQPDEKAVPPEAAGDSERDADRRVQRALGRASRILGDQFGGLIGHKPDGLDRAATAMSRATGALGRGDDKGAAAAEREALADLQAGGKQMAQSLANAERSGQGGAMALLPGPGATGAGGDDGEGTPDDPSASAAAPGERDPLGRAVDTEGRGEADDQELAIPDNGAEARSRALEEELRKRDSDRQRPQQELDYLGRLLQPF